MQEVSLLINISIALVVAFIGGLLARRVGLPAMVGYLLAGIIIGPFTPGFVGDTDTIQQLAELGVILLMFGVGLQFSFVDLWKARDVAPASLLRMATIALVGFWLARAWGWSTPAAIVLGLGLGGASTVVLMRGLVDNSLLNTRHGQAAVSWSVAEDLATVVILVLMPSLTGAGGSSLRAVGLTLAAAAAFGLLMAFVGVRLFPWLLHLIARTRSRELFILAVLAVALGTAVASAELFGVSLALGAFVAGVVVSESPVSHQVAAEILPFRDAFAVLFFVSIGMLVNPGYLLLNIGPVLVLTLLVIVGKSVLTVLMGFALSRPAYTTLVIAAGTSQIGEFSFILGQAGLSLGLLDGNQYSLLLAVALLSIAISPLMFRGLPRVEALLRRMPRVWWLLDRHGPAPVQPEEALAGHIVLVGYGRVGHHIVDVAESLHIPHLVIESDFERVEELNSRGAVTLYGDAANSEVLPNAGLERARALVVTVPDQVGSELIVASARALAPELPIIVRAATTAGVDRLAQLGAQDVIHPELEGGLEIVRHTLLRLGFPLREVSRYTDAVRRDHYDVQIDSQDEHRMLRELLQAMEGIEIEWRRLEAGSPLIGRTLREADLRARTGASLVAVIRNGRLTANPKSQTVFWEGDRIGLIGEPEQIEAAAKLGGRSNAP